MQVNLAVICPMGRDDAANVRKTFESQTWDKARLVVVENGAGLGACSKGGLEPWKHLTSEQHQSHAKNAGLGAVLADGWATHWTTWDSDDEYRPGYLAELVAALEEGHRFVGKCAHFRRMSGRLTLWQQLGDRRLVEGVQGPTITSVLWDEVPRFPVMPWGEDWEWQVLAKPTLGEPWSTSPLHFVYDRTNPLAHTFPFTDEQLMAWRACDAWEVIAANEDDVIDGRSCAFELQALPQPKISLREHPAFHLAT